MRRQFDVVVRSSVMLMLTVTIRMPPGCSISLARSRVIVYIPVHRSCLQCECVPRRNWKNETLGSSSLSGVSLLGKGISRGLSFALGNEPLKLGVTDKPPPADHERVEFALRYEAAVDVHPRDANQPCGFGDTDREGL